MFSPLSCWALEELDMVWCVHASLMTVCVCVSVRVGPQRVFSGQTEMQDGPTRSPDSIHSTFKTHYSSTQSRFLSLRLVQQSLLLILLAQPQLILNVITPTSLTLPYWLSTMLTSPPLTFISVLFYSHPSILICETQTPFVSPFPHGVSFIHVFPTLSLLPRLSLTLKKIHKINC